MTNGFKMRWETEVLILGDDDRLSLAHRASWLAQWCGIHPSASLKDLAFTLNSEFDSHRLRLAIVASSIHDLKDKLHFAAKRLDELACQRINDRSGIYYQDEPSGSKGKVAFLFPGEGAQYPNMLSDLCLHFTEVRACFDLLDRALQGQGSSPSLFIFPPSGSDSRSQVVDNQLWQMNGAVEAVFTANRALLALLEKLQIIPDVVLGHSTGEYNALLAAGTIRFEDEQQLIKNVRAGNSLSEQLVAEGRIPEGALLAIGPAPESLIKSTLESMHGSLWLAMDNCPHQVVLFGSESAIEQATNHLRQTGTVCQRLPFSRAYHTPLFAQVRTELEAFFSTLNVSSPRIQIYSCATARPYPLEPERIRELMLDQWTTTVKFRAAITNMYDDGVRVFIEVGPRGNLTSFVKDILRGKPHVAIPANLAHGSALTQINHLVARLAANNIPVRTEHLFDRRKPQRISFDLEASKPSAATTRLALALPLMKGPSIKKKPSLTSDKSLATGRPAANMPAQSSGNGNHSETAKRLPDLAPAKSSGMQEYLRTMERFLETQQNVMQAFLARRGANGKPSRSNSVPGFHLESSESPSNGNSAIAVVSTVDPAATETIPAPIDIGTNESIEDILLEIVVDKTGYPREMLDLSASLEADLGIDSIKRVEILGTFQRTTNLFSSADIESVSRLKTLGQIIDMASSLHRAPDNGQPELARTVSLDPQIALSSHEQVSQNINAPNGHCFIERLEVLVPGKTARASKVFDLNEDLFLKDHSLGGRVSARDVDLCALIVIPLTISLECLAQVASLLVPGKSLLAIRDIHANRWIAFNESQVTVEISADVNPNSSLEINARLTDKGTNETREIARTPAVEATLVFGDQAEPTLARTIILSNPHSSPFRPEQLYTEVMFHGPAFQGVAGVDALSDNGISATLRVPAEQGLFRAPIEPRFLTSPLVLDAVGQLVGFWTAHTFSERYVVFPFHVKNIELYVVPTAGALLTARAEMVLISDGEITSDIEVVDSNGAVSVRIEGWKDKRIDMPDDFFRFRMSPLKETMSSAWPSVLAHLPVRQNLVCCRLSLNESLLHAERGIWCRVLANLVLSRSERQVWEAMSGTHKRRTQWLLGRVVAKDAVRFFVREQSGVDLYPADIEIFQDAYGRPLVKLFSNNELECAPVISIAHSNGITVALAGDHTDWKGIGFDVEPLGRMQNGFESVAFTAEEQDLLSSQNGLRAEHMLRLWCAKEAAAKALGRGLIGGPQGLLARQLDASTGIVKMVLSGEMARQFPELRDTDLFAYTAREGDLIVASSFCRRIEG